MLTRIYGNLAEGFGDADLAGARTLLADSAVLVPHTQPR